MSPHIVCHIQPDSAAMSDLVYKPLHPTFGASVEGADFTTITPELANEIQKGLAKVCAAFYTLRAGLITSMGFWCLGRPVLMMSGTSSSRSSSATSMISPLSLAASDK